MSNLVRVAECETQKYLYEREYHKKQCMKNKSSEFDTKKEIYLKATERFSKWASKHSNCL